MSKLIIIVGLCLVGVGIILYYFPNAISWLGKLPGDVRIERDNFNFYFPITTMILVSMIGSVIMKFLK